MFTCFWYWDAYLHKFGMFLHALPYGVHLPSNVEPCWYASGAIWRPSGAIWGPSEPSGSHLRSSWGTARGSAVALVGFCWCSCIQVPGTLHPKPIQVPWGAPVLSQILCLNPNYFEQFLFINHLVVPSKGWAKNNVPFCSVVYFGKLPTSISWKRFVRMT